MSQLLPADFFVLRTPTLPWDLIRTWCEGLEGTATHAAGGDLAAALARDAGMLRARLRDIVRRPEVQAALRVASPSLCTQLRPWLDGDDSEAAAGVEPALVRYVLRMAGRATPFGLFAGTTFGISDARTALVVPPVETHTRHTRLNLDWVFALAFELSKRAAFRPYLRFRANETAYEAGGRLRYYELRVSQSQRTYHLCDIAASPYHQVALAAARRNDGATIAQIADALAAASAGVERDEALQYVADLVRIQLLCSTLLPAVTGPDPLLHLLEELRKIPPAAEVAESIQSLRDDVAAVDAAGYAVDDAAYEQLARKLRALSDDIDPTRLVRVDLRKPSHGVTLNEAILREIAAGGELLTRMGAQPNSPIERFAREFDERYQGREVPLLEALDSELGIGFAQPRGVDVSPLVKGLKCEPHADRDIKWGDRDQLLLDKLGDALRTGATEIALSTSDIESLSVSDAEPPPPGQTALVRIAAASQEALEAGDYRLLISSAAGTTTGALLGRFLHDEPDLDARMRATLRKEEEPDRDALHAEIAHHLEGLATNVSCRPVLRDYEIEVAGGSGAPAARRIPLGDLLVSVRHGKVRLRSATHGRRVVPHLSCAHAYNNSGLPAYRLLAHLQEQGVRRIRGWSWGPVLDAAPFLPRVTHGRFVLSLARWRIPVERIRTIQPLRRHERFRAIQELRADRKLPRFVRLVDGDNLLPVDLDNVLAIESMLGACKHLSSITMTELFPADDELVARGPAGGFHHELLVPLLRAPTENAPARTMATLNHIDPRPDRARRPGDDWLYLKLYCGVATLDRLLVDLVAPLVRQLRGEGVIDQWFFIRYGDPDWHLRLRLHGQPQALWTHVAPRVFEAISAVRALVHKVTVDTYDPEIERYGGEEAVALAEQLFEADSDAALAIVAGFRRDPDARWRIALAGMNAMLDDFAFPMDAKREIASLARDGQAHNVRPGPELARQLGDKFRGLHAEVDGLLHGLPERLAAGNDILARRSDVLRRLAPRLRELDQRGRLTAPIASVATSHLHMWANRVFRGSSNLHEYVLYDLLYRVYRSRIARSRSKAGGGAAIPTAMG